MPANNRTYIITCSLILAKNNSDAAIKIINQWIDVLIDHEDIIHGEIEGVTSCNTLDEPDEPLYDFKGFDNFPGKPL